MKGLGYIEQIRAKAVVEQAECEGEETKKEDHPHISKQLLISK